MTAAYAGQGQPAAAQAATPESLTNGAALYKKTEIGNMPALGKRLKPEEITDIVNHVRTLAK